MAQYRRLSGGKEPNAEYRYLEALMNLRSGRVKEPWRRWSRSATSRAGHR